MRSRCLVQRRVVPEIMTRKTALTHRERSQRFSRPARAAEVIGFVPALELVVREISDQFLLQDEQIEIASLCQAGLSIRQVANRWAGPLDSVAGAAPQRDRDSGLPAIRSPRLRDVAAGPPSPEALRDQARVRAAGRQAASAAVEPTADQPAAAPAVSGRAGDVAVSREHLPGCLPCALLTGRESLSTRSCRRSRSASR
jgi:hypothetical protein